MLPKIYLKPCMGYIEKVSAYLDHLLKDLLVGVGLYVGNLESVVISVKEFRILC